MKTIKSRIRHCLDNWSSGNIESLEKLVNDYQYVSFDIFDTLVKRDVPNPTDVFSIIENELGIEGFKDLRIKAEKEAREKCVSEEVTLSEIYNCLPNLDPIIQQRAEGIETQIEINVCTVNQDLIKVFNSLSQNKDIILVSDMYLDCKTVVEILNRCGIFGYKKIYLSSELNKTKHKGSMYRAILDDLGIRASDIVHIGNSFKADYLMARKCGIKAFKISTEGIRTQRKYKNVLCRDDKEKLFLNAFINNHTPCGANYYSLFGYEAVGPLLYGFISWLFEEMKNESIEQVFFLARDGFIMQKVYKELGFDKFIPDYYLEVSRRSLRVPYYKRGMTYDEIMREISVPNKTNLIQIIDSWGLEVEKYKHYCSDKNINIYEHIDRDGLMNNKSVRELFGELYEEIIENSEMERENLIGYLNQFDFNKKSAIVDIGWRGSMQKYLQNALNYFLGIDCDLNGFYIGLTEGAKHVLEDRKYQVKGYAFDRFNGESQENMERPFVGLFETLFLEQDGSVKNYDVIEGKYVAVRSPYEYADDNGLFTQEALSVKQLQDGVIRFVSDYKYSIISKCIRNKSNLAFSNLYEIGTSPQMKDVSAFGDFDFYDNGSKVKLASPVGIRHYLFNFRRFKRDIYDSRWKIGFLKRLLKMPLPYLNVFRLMQKND